MKKILLAIILCPFLNFSQIQVGQTLNGEFGLDNFGDTVSISSNGSIIAIGASNYSYDNLGYVRVYENISGTWIQIGDDISNGPINTNFGISIALSSDGSIIVVGDNRDNGDGQQRGLVKVFENVNNSWVQLGQDIFGVSDSDGAGYSVDISGNGNIIAVGSARNDDNGNNSGHVRIFENIGGTWTQIGQNINGEYADDLLGASFIVGSQAVSLSFDGDIIAIGAESNGGFASQAGHVRVFENIAGTWNQIGEDIDGEYAGDNFGYTVELNSDGSTVILGARGGGTRIFTNDNGVWTQVGNAITSENSNDCACVVSISGDGNIVAVADPLNDGDGLFAGHVRVFSLVNNLWTQLGQEINGQLDYGSIGGSIELSEDGSTLIVGASVISESRIYGLNDLLGISEQVTFDFSFYPNPTQNQITIQLNSDVELQNINIYDSLGKIVLTTKENIINLSKLSTGLYIIEIHTNKGKGSKKLIVE